MKPLGIRGRQVLDQITTQTARRGYPPLRREIAEAMGVSVALVQQVLNDLHDRKLVSWEHGQQRTFKVLEAMGVDLVAAHSKRRAVFADLEKRVREFEADIVATRKVRVNHYLEAEDEAHVMRTYEPTTAEALAAQDAHKAACEALRVFVRDNPDARCFVDYSHSVDLARAFHGIKPGMTGGGA